MEEDRDWRGWLGWLGWLAGLAGLGEGNWKAGRGLGLGSGWAEGLRIGLGWAWAGIGLGRWDGDGEVRWDGGMGCRGVAEGTVAVAPKAAAPDGWNCYCCERRSDMCRVRRSGAD